MDLNIRPVGNGWIIYPGDESRSMVTLNEKVMVFNRFEDLCEYLKKTWKVGT